MERENNPPEKPCPPNLQREGKSYLNADTKGMHTNVALVREREARKEGS